MSSRTNSSNVSQGFQFHFSFDDTKLGDDRMQDGIIGVELRDTIKCCRSRSLARIAVNSVKQQKSDFCVDSFQPLRHFLNVANFVHLICSFDFVLRQNMTHKNGVFHWKFWHEENRTSSSYVNSTIIIRLQDSKSPMKETFLSKNRTHI